MSLIIATVYSFVLLSLAVGDGGREGGEAVHQWPQAAVLVSAVVAYTAIRTAVRCYFIITASY
eukprot:SAG31_NODE_5725_length_2359_cov_1.242478_1_plen_63_part_00